MTTPIGALSLSVVSAQGSGAGSKAPFEAASAAPASLVSGPRPSEVGKAQPAARFDGLGALVRAAIIEPQGGAARLMTLALRPVPDDPLQANAQSLVNDMKNRPLVDWQGRMLRLEQPGLVLPRNLPLELREVTTTDRRGPGTIAPQAAGTTDPQGTGNPGGLPISASPREGSLSARPLMLNQGQVQAQGPLSAVQATPPDGAAATRTATGTTISSGGTTSVLPPAARAEQDGTMNGGTPGAPDVSATSRPVGDATLARPASQPSSAGSTGAQGLPAPHGNSIDAGGSRTLPPNSQATGTTLAGFDSPAALPQAAGGAAVAGSVGESLRLAAALLVQSLSVLPRIASPRAIGLPTRERQSNGAADDTGAVLGPSPPRQTVSASMPAASEPVLLPSSDMLPAARDPTGDDMAKAATPAAEEIGRPEPAQLLRERGDDPGHGEDLPAVAQDPQATRSGPDQGGAGARQGPDDEGDRDGCAILECELGHLGRLTIRLEWTHDRLAMRVDAESELQTHERAGLLDIFGSACEIAGAKGHLILASDIRTSRKDTAPKAVARETLS